jgi:hypothetical protein
MRTNAAVRGNSTTAQQLGDMVEGKMGQLGWFISHPIRSSLNFAGNIFLKQATKQAAERNIHALTEPQTFEAAMRELQARQPGLLSRMIPGTLTGAVGGLLGQ